MRESGEKLKITKSGKRAHSRMLSQQETSMFESMSNPGTTSSLKDVFEKMNEVEDNTLHVQIEGRNQRSQSVEEDLKAIRDAGHRLMSSSTQGFQLLWARTRYDIMTSR